VIEEVIDVDGPSLVEQTDRAYWEKRRDAASLAVMDKLVAALQSNQIETRLTYNKHHIALGSTGNNYCWFHPRKTAGFCHMEIRLNPDTRDGALSSLQSKGIDAYPRRTDSLTFSITNEQVDEHLNSLIEVLKAASALSK
jgi:hypothetical protein